METKHTVRKSGLPSELLEQRAALLDVAYTAKAMYEALGITKESRIGGEQYKKLLEAIKKATT